MKKTFNFLKKNLASRWSIIYSTLSGRVTQWGSTLNSKSEGFWLEYH